MVQSLNSRMAAAETIAAVLDGGEGLPEVQDAAIGVAAADPRDLAFSRHLAYGVLRWLSALEWIASQLMDRPLKERDRDIHRLILVGLFELWHHDAAQHAAINETAECARLAGKPWAVGLINAVLRRFQRERGQWLDALESRPERFAHPQWLIERIRSDWPSNWEAVLEANNRHAGLWLRVNRARSSVKDAAEAFREAGFETRAHPHAESALQIIPPAPVESLPGFAEGNWSVQDPAAQLAVDWLDVKAGNSVLDACAAPGGKTCHLLESAPGARVTALDRSEARLSRMRDNARRLGVADSDQFDVRVGDAEEPDSWWDGEPFDRILLDAPCTATGVIRRHPEIKWLRSPQQVDEAVALQAGLLQSLWPLLKPGGILVYATCSVLGDENSQQIRRFLENHEDAQPQRRDVPYGHPGGEGQQILPGEADMDGFFYARVGKRA